VYVPGNAAIFQRKLLWVSRNGAIETINAPPGAYTDPSISPDGRSVAVSMQGPVQTLWIYDFARATLTTLPSNGSSQAPRWSADGRRLIYRGTRAGYRNLFWRSADGSGEEVRLTTIEGNPTPGGPSRDGTYLPFTTLLPDTGRDIWLLDLRQPSEAPRPLVRTRATEVTGEVSPDGRWLAYLSDESGRVELYLRPFPNPGGRIAISRDGAAEPRWSRDGKELFYRNANKMMAVTIGAGASPTAGAPRLLFEGLYQISDTGGGGYDVAADGRFLMIQRGVVEENATRINVVLGWLDDMKARVTTTP
jgi:serine/threonine-protein kinase